MKVVLHWLRGFLPACTTVNHIEQGRACLGALLGIFLTGSLTLLIVGPSSAVPLLIAPMGASAVLLFAVPASPLAQPWSVMGGNTVSALIGMTAALHIADPFIAGAVAVAGAIGGMFALRCLHPPGGAVALTAVVGGSEIAALGYKFVLMPAALNSVLILLVALLYNNSTRRRYPHTAPVESQKNPQTSDSLPSERLGFTAADLDAVLQKYNQVLDIGRDDLQNLFQQTEMHAYRRRFGEILCADIMSRAVISATPDMPLAHAWQLMMQHRIKALPVIDAEHRLAGIITRYDFMREMGFGTLHGLAGRLHSLIRRRQSHGARKGSTVGDVMTRSVHTARQDQHIAELVPLLCDRGLHHLPVVDQEQRLAGILTQSDLIAALYHGKLADAGLHKPTVKRVI